MATTREFIELKEKIEKNLGDDRRPWAGIFKFLEENTGISRYNIFWGTALFLLVWLAFGYAGQLICNFIAILYPSYASIQALESKETNDDIKWLTYWVVFSIFSYSESFLYFLVSFVPLYWLIKCLFFVWLMIPTNLNGSLILYHNFIRPYFLQYQSRVDEALHKAQTAAGDLLHTSTSKDD